MNWRRPRNTDQAEALVQAYVIDQVRDKMIGNEAAIGVTLPGEAIYTVGESQPGIRNPKRRLQCVD